MNFKITDPPDPTGHPAKIDTASLDVTSVAPLSHTGDFAGSDEERKLLCLLSDGRLLIADGQAMNPHVLSYRARLERMNRPYRVEVASIHKIAQIYRSYTGGKEESSSSGHSMMQITAKDLLSKACRERASDIHIRVKKTSTELYFRVHNDLVKVSEQTREYGERLLATLYGAMTAVSDNAYKPTERQDASIGDRDKLPPMLYGVRIATAPANEGAVMVLRLLYNDAGENIDLEPLGFTHEQALAIQTLKEQPIGMNIISGPTGSGKSTTLQRVLMGEVLASEGKLHILTIEDPIEYPIEGAVQTSITNAGTEEERSRLFSAAIANAMRLDPDTIMIGEIRDRASGQNALRAAMTGHQVWSTVHANSAIAIADRLVDLGLPLTLVADHGVVTGLISQRLVKVLCPNCKQQLIEHPDQLPEAMYARVKKAVGRALPRVCIRGPGCDQCRQLGTIGRTVVAEVIVPDAQFYMYLRAGDKIKATQYWLNQMGGKTILAHAIEKVSAGIVDPRMAEKIVGHLYAEEPTGNPRFNVVEAALGN